ncbi:LTA synthase family protein [Segetibacter sp. 3557_3]|uniref:LTA synthase family protein n=1 Tax=Segetibacter sp. 3557_3 TaxID=2547429 RepID=UPI0010586AB7|nr:LTA synthase family protein [Segetibacter sp. 3557_3]TDH25483.1 LTA synthase family protein [Segetibacter sp. 3557_3]
MQKLKIPRYIQWLILTGLFFLLLMTLLRIALVYTGDHHRSSNGLLPAFVLGIRYDLRVVCIVAMLSFLLGSLKFLHPFQTRRGNWLSLLLWSIFIIVFVSFYVFDFAHYAYLAQRLNGSVLNYLEDAKLSLGMVWQSYPVIWILIALASSIFLLIGLVRTIYNYILSKPIKSNRNSRIVWGITFFLLLSVGIFGRVGQFPLRWSDAFSLADDYKSQVALNPFQSFFSSLSYRHATYDLKKVRRHYPYMADHLNVTTPDSIALNYKRFVTHDAKAPKPNIVLVICESFSAYKSSMMGNPLNTTPFFNQMVAKGVYFDKCFSPSYGTARGVWAIITGIPDVQLQKTSSRNPAAVDQHTIINDFEGYEKFYFLGGSTSWANIRGLLTNNIAGLNLYEEGSYQAAKIDVWGISDKNLFLEANKVLASRSQPFFAVIQTADNHRPYTIPEEDLDEFERKRVPADTLRKYGFGEVDEYNAFRYTDFSFRKFMEAAAKESYYSNTIFVFVGDHGIKGDAGTMLPRAFSTQSLTSEHVPLLFYAPSMMKPARYSYPASQLDILPTIAGLAKVNYTNTTLGKDLLAADSTWSEKVSFIIDVDSRTIGVVTDSCFYSYNMSGQNEQLSSILNNNPVQLTKASRSKYRAITDAYYETSRYLLLNNKKTSAK